MGSLQTRSSKSKALRVPVCMPRWAVVRCRCPRGGWGVAGCVGGEGVGVEDGVGHGPASAGGAGIRLAKGWRWRMFAVLAGERTYRQVGDRSMICPSCCWGWPAPGRFRRGCGAGTSSSTIRRVLIELDAEAADRVAVRAGVAVGGRTGRRERVGEYTGRPSNAACCWRGGSCYRQMVPGRRSCGEGAGAGGHDGDHPDPRVLDEFGT